MFCASTTPQPTRPTHQHPTTSQPTRPTHQHPTNTPNPPTPDHIPTNTPDPPTPNQHAQPTNTRPHPNQHAQPTNTQPHPYQHPQPTNTHVQPTNPSTHTPNPSLHIKQNNCKLHSHNNDLKIILYANFVHKHCHILDSMKVHMHKNMQKAKRNNMNEPTLQVEVNCFVDNWKIWIYKLLYITLNLVHQFVFFANKREHISALIFVFKWQSQWDVIK